MRRIEGAEGCANPKGKTTVSTNRDPSELSIIFIPTLLCLILWVLIFSPHCLLSLHKCLLILLIFSMNRLWFIDSWFVLYIGFTDFITKSDYFLQSLLDVTSFSCRDFLCAVKLLVSNSSTLFIKALGAMKFPLSTLFIVSHKFENAVYSFSLKVFNFFFCLAHFSFSRELFSFHNTLSSLYFLLFISSFNQWWSGSI